MAMLRLISSTWNSSIIFLNLVEAFHFIPKQLWVISMSASCFGVALVKIALESEENISNWPNDQKKNFHELK